MIFFLFFFVYYRLDDHLHREHQHPRDKHSCDLCSRAYCTRSVLLRHKAVAHNEFRKYPCEHCKKVCMPMHIFRQCNMCRVYCCYIIWILTFVDHLHFVYRILRECIHTYESRMTCSCRLLRNVLNTIYTFSAQLVL